VIEQHRRVKTQRKIARAKRQHARLPATRATSVAVSRTVSAPTRERVASAAPAPAVSPPGPARASVRARNRPARPGARVHVVASGESLWSIASDHLGANASSAEVGREVERLWQVNRARIGTGDRNLLIAGTVLRLA